MFFRLILLITAFCVTQLVFGQFVWIENQNVPFSERDDAVAVSLNGYGYAGTGFNSSFSPLNDWWRYNPVDDSWLQMADFTGDARQYAVAFTLNNLIYVGTGVGNGNYYNDLWAYSPENDSWTQKTSLPAAARSSCAVFTIGDFAYLCGGFFGLTDHSDEAWKYSSLDDSWIQVASLPVELRLAMGFQIADFGYVAGGFNEISGTLNTTFKYDAVNNTWSQSGNLPAPRLGAKAVGLPTYALAICGGSNFSEFANTVFGFNHLNAQWTNQDPFIGEARKGGIAFAIEDQLYFGLGISAPPLNQRLNDFYQLYVGTSIADSNDFQFQVFPNPAQDFFQLKMNLPPGLIHLKVLDMKGSLIHEQLVESGSRISTLNWSPGVYMLHLNQNQSTNVVRLVVQP